MASMAPRGAGALSVGDRAGDAREDGGPRGAEAIREAVGVDRRRPAGRNRTRSVGAHRLRIP